MKKLIFIIVFLTSLCDAQIKDLNRLHYYSKGSFEYSFFFNIGSSSTEIKENIAPFGLPSMSSENEADDIHLHIGASAGYYFLNNFSLDPELDINLTGEYSSYVVIGNLSYSFSSPTNNITPFIKAGYGWGKLKNEVYSSRDAESDGFKVINSAAGLKVRYTENMIFKVEINYRILLSSIESTNIFSPDNYIKIKSDISINTISLSLGISVLL